MRIDLASLDPRSPLSRRIQEALRGDAARHVQVASVVPSSERAGDGRRPRKDLASQARPGAAGEFWPSEEKLHKAIYEMAEREKRPGVIVFHPANGGARSKAEAGRLTGMGVVPGVPDLNIISAGGTNGL